MSDLIPELSAPSKGQCMVYEAEDGLWRNNDIHRKMILAMAQEGVDFPWEESYAKFKELLDTGASSLKIFTHPDRKALLLPLMKRAELVYEEWIVSSGTSIVLSPTALEENLGAGLSEKIGQLNGTENAQTVVNTEGV